MKHFMWLGAVVCVCVAQPSAALASEHDTRADAHTRFERGLQLYRDGDHAGALAEFAHVHEALPDEYVLFNIGLVYAAMNRPVEAKATLNRLLQNPGRLSPQRLAQASRTRDTQARRVATLAVTTNVAAVIEIDGLEVARTPLAPPIAIASGMHIVTARAAGHSSCTREVIAAGEVETQLTLLLEPVPLTRAHLVVESALPAAEVSIDGVPVGVTPLAASIPVTPGRLLVELRREGYMSARRSIELGDGALGHLHIDPTVDLRLPRSKQGLLALKLREPYAYVAIDGGKRGPYLGPLLLPAGPHRVRVERAGFEPTERQVVVPAGREVTFGVKLQPTPETRQLQIAEANAEERWAWIATGSGLALALGGAGLAVWGQATLPDLRSQLTAATRDSQPMSGGECDKLLAPPAGMGRRRLRNMCEARVDALQGDVSQRETWRTVGAIVGGTGLALSVLGIYLLATKSDLEGLGPGSVATRPWVGRGEVGASLSFHD
jgi:hypothetical protein